MRQAGMLTAASVFKTGWTIVHRQDAAMDLHLSLMVEAADEALRSLRAADEQAGCRHKQPRRTAR